MPTDSGRHDLVGRLCLEQPVLMDARLMGKGVRPDYGLVRLDRRPGHRRDEPARRVYLLAHDPRVEGEDVFPRPQDHDDLFKGGVAGSLADAVDRAFHLPRPGLTAAMELATARPRSLWQWTLTTAREMFGHMLHNIADQLAEFVGHRIAHRIRDVYGGRARIDGHGQDRHRVIPVAPRRVHGGELHVGRIAGCPASPTLRRCSAPRPGSCGAGTSGVCRRWR